MKLKNADHLAPEDHGRARHRRAPPAAGRPHQAQARQGQGDGLPRLGLPTLFGEKVVMRLLDKSNLQLDMTKLGFDAEPLARVQGGDRQAVRHGAGDRPHRLGQDHDALLRARRAEQDRRQHLHRGGPGRVQLRRHQPGADARGHRPQLRGRAARASCGRIPTSSWSARSATSRRRRSGSRRRSPATWCSRRCTPTTRPAPSRRLLNMGIEPFLVTAAVNLIVAQRLARKLCGECKKAVDDPRPGAHRRRRPARGDRHVRGLRARRLQDLQRPRLQGPRRAVRGHAASGMGSRSW